MSFSKQDALKIAEKLDARINTKTNRHDRVLIEYEGKIILGFGMDGELHGRTSSAN